MTAKGVLTTVTLWSIVCFHVGGALFAQPQTEAIPTPESSLGFTVGADFKLATYEESIAYFHKLDEASDRLTMMEAGVTSEGRKWELALISSAENLRNIDRLREIARKLASSQDLAPREAQALADEGRAVVDINGGLHASEVAGAQHTIQLAYELLSRADEPYIKSILDNVVVLLWPSLNPDGQDIVVNWYRSNLGTPYEVSPLVQLYQKYIGHDNNRDAYMLNMIESRVLARTWRYWEPQIIYVHHQTAPFPTRIWLPPFAEPIASQTPPLMAREVNMIGTAIASGLESKGLPGATHMGTGFDAWYPGYVDYLPMMQHRVAFWTETALYRYATPHFYTVSDFPKSDRSLRPESLYPSPWKGGWWRLGDAVQYMVTASLSVLDYAGKYRRELLFNRYQSTRDTVKKYRQEPPYAFFVPVGQRDPVAAVEMLRRLAFNGVQVFRLQRSVTLEGWTHEAGTWVVPLDQPFGELARQVLSVQSYPDLREFPDGPPEQPYDAAGWSLPLQMGVAVREAQSPLPAGVRDAMSAVQGNALDWEAEGVEDASVFDSVAGVGFDSDSVAAGIVPPPGKVVGTGSLLLLDPAQNNSFAALNRALKAGARVRWTTETPGESDSGGRYVVEGASPGAQSDWVRDLALQASRANAAEGPAVTSRIALYRPWQPSIDEGWTRWLLERYGFDFTGLRNSDFQEGSLRRFDVVVLPEASPEGLLEGYAKGEVPPRYEGGIGAQGVRLLDAFVRGGGTLVALNRASDFAIEALHLPVENVVAKLKRHEFFCRGSILEVEVNVHHPVMSGMPERASVFFDRSPVFTTLEGFEGRALAKYPKAGSPLLSGYLLGEDRIQGYAAALEVKHGKGRVLLIGFRPQWRGQPFGTFKTLFNSVLYSGELAAKSQGSEDFWMAPAPSTKKETKPETR